MARTFNRVPNIVDLPDKRSLKKYFFNQYNWTGFNDDKNFVAVDQNSFSSCENVYVDTEGVLRSRPYLKLKVDEKIQMVQVDEVWEFGPVNVYRKGTTLYFIQDGQPDPYYVTVALATTSCKLVIAHNNIFIFESSSLKRYNLSTKTWYSADDFIYIPTTKVVSNGVTDDYESPNELTTSYVTRYLFNNMSAIDSVELYGKNVSINIGGEVFDVTFNEDTYFTIMEKKKELPDNAYANQWIMGSENEGLPLLDFVSVDGYNLTLLCTCDTTLRTSNNYVPTNNWKLYWSMNDITFYSLDNPGNIIAMPRLSKDGSMVCVLKNDGLYVISIVKNENESLTYPNWYKLLSLTINDHCTSTITPSGDYYYNLTCQCSISVISDDTYFISYYDEPVYNTNIILDHCVSYHEYIYYVKSGTTIYNSYSIWTNNINVSSEYGANNGGLQHVSIRKGNNTNNYVPSLVTWNYNHSSVAIYSYNYIVNSSDSTQYWYAPTCIVIDNTIRLVTIVSLSTYPSTNITVSYKNDFSFGNKLLISYSTYSSSKYNQHIFENNSIKFSSLDYDENPYLRFNSSINSLTYIINEKLYVNEIINVLINSEETVHPLYFNDDVLKCECDFILYSNILSNSNVYIDYLSQGTYNYFIPEHTAELSEYYFSKGNTLYISKTNDVDNFKWYFPKVSTQNFDYSITNLHTISPEEVAIFQEDNIYYVSWDNDLKAYRYYKSRVDIGLKEGSEVITTYDGKYTIFNTKRGLVAMSYQEFVASTEQALTYISDKIFSHYEQWVNNDAIKLCRYKYWIIAYKTNSKFCLIYDLRNNSWWPLKYNYDIQKFIVLDDELVILLNKSVYTNNKDDETIYMDYLDTNVNIDWFIKSQKLHLDAINYYKEIQAITLNNTFNDDVDLDDDNRNKKKMKFKLKVKLFRTDIGEDHYGSIVQQGSFGSNDYLKVIDYDIDCISTFVQRVNFMKVLEFQFELYNPDDQYQRIPLSLTNITVKYKLGSQVR